MRMLIAFAVMLLLATPLTDGHTQARNNYSGNTSFDFGVLPGFSGGFNQGGGVENILEVGIVTGGGADFLGCAGVDLFSFAETTFNFNFNVDRFVNNLKTKVSKWALTQMMATPQIAAVFDTLNQMENFRWDMFNESCNLGEIKADAREQATQFCVSQTGMSEARCRERYDSEATGYLTQAADMMLNFDRAFGTILDAVQDTHFCSGSTPGSGIQDGGDAACALIGFIPQMRFCHTSDTGGAGCATVGDIEMGEQMLQYPFLLEAGADIYAEQIFGSTQNMLEGLLGERTLDEMRLAASGLEAALRSGDIEQFPAYNDLSPVTQDYLRTTGCSFYQPNIAENKFYELLTGTPAPDGLLADFDEFRTQMRGTMDAQGLASGFEAMGASADEAEELLTAAITCAGNEDNHISIPFHLELLTYSRERRENLAQFAAVQASGGVISKLIRYTRTQLQIALGQLDSGDTIHPTFPSGGCPDNEVALSDADLARIPADERPAPCTDITVERPQFVLNGIRVALETLENQQNIIDEQRRRMAENRDVSHIFNR